MVDISGLPNRAAEFPFMRTRKKRPVSPVPTQEEQPVKKLDFTRPRGHSSTPDTFSEAVAHRAPRNPTHEIATTERKAEFADLPVLDTPVFHGNVELSMSYPAVHLDRIQSGVGSLRITGAEAFAWEEFDFLSGIKVKGGIGDSSIDPTSYANRPLLGWNGEDVIVNLRHVKKIRRFVISSRISDLFVELYDGSRIFAPMDGGNNALIGYRVGNELEFRLEKIDTTDLLGAFGIIASNVPR